MTFLTVTEMILTAERRRELTGPALRAFFGISTAWKLTPNEQIKLLGLSNQATLRRWRRGNVQTLKPDTLERISYVLGIFRGINTLLPQPARADAWFRKPNSAPLFGGGTALDRMAAGNIGDLFAVWRYINAQLPPPSEL